MEQRGFHKLFKAYADQMPWVKISSKSPVISTGGTNLKKKKIGNFLFLIRTMNNCNNLSVVKVPLKKKIKFKS